MSAPLVRGGVIEAPPDNQGGPRWVVRLSDGSTIIGRPSWMTSGPRVALPEPGRSDWGRLMARLEDTPSVRIVGMSLYVPPFGRFPAPDNAGAYGYYEEMAIAQQGPKRGPNSGCRALAICWLGDDGKVQLFKIFANGELQKWVKLRWLPCMIGDRASLDLGKAHDQETQFQERV